VPVAGTVVIVLIIRRRRKSGRKVSKKDGPTRQS
jgi:hypothetical protein